ncbi:MAG: NBR1-Ig-like domain-containing protein [Anaerolineales bacterium]
MSIKIGLIYRHKALLAILLGLALIGSACVRSAASSEEELAGLATEKAIETADAEIQLTLEALLGSATVVAPSATLEATSSPAEAEATATLESVQLTELAVALTEAAASPTLQATNVQPPTETPTPNPTSTPCYGARYVYDETYPDGTRVDPGQAMQKTWRLQNVGSCDWSSGQFELVFVAGDRMAGETPLTINITVLAGNYANFSINMKAPVEPGTYRGEWMLRTKGGDTFGVGPDFTQPIWIEIIVRG